MDDKQQLMRVGFLGYGTIARRVQALISERAADQMRIVAALVKDASKERPAGSPTIVSSLEALLAERPEVVVEAGGHDALRAYGAGVLRAGVDLIMVSVGAFATPGLEEEIAGAARLGGARARVPSGAIGALDAISSGAIGGLTRVTHTTRKPPRTLLPAEEAARLTEATEIFSGTAREGALKFPENINVAAAVSLAGLGLDRTEVRVLADPAVERNQHEVVAEGEFGRLRFEIQNIPTEKPATGRIVAMSVFHELLARRAAFLVG